MKLINSHRKYFKVILCLLLVTLTGCSKEDSSLEDKFEKEKQPFAFVIETGATLEGTDGITAKHCGECHQTIYEQWKQSTHAKALSDLQFQAELTKDDSPKWLCLNCHIPLHRQREYTVTGLKKGNVLEPTTIPNKDFDKNLQQEAITCATCHIRINPETGKNTIIGPYGSEHAPHPTIKNIEFLRNTCLRCHDPKGEALTENLLCWFTTNAESLESPKKEQKDCVDCHMPPSKQHLADNFPHLPKRQLHAHHWVGSGIPKRKEDYKQLKARGYTSSLKINIIEIKTSPTTLTAEISIANESNGHYLPTGDPERFILVEAFLTNGEKVLDKSKYRIGQTWEWNPAKKIDDNRLKQNEKRTWNINLNMPESNKNLYLIIQAKHIRLSKENRAHMMTTFNKTNEDLLKDGAALTQKMDQIYPTQNWVYYSKTALDTMLTEKASDEDLIKASYGSVVDPLAPFQNSF